MKRPKYFYRPDDYAIFEQMENENYALIDRPYKGTEADTEGYQYEVMLSCKFIPCEEKDFDILKKKSNLYYKYLGWSSRNDGHGGSKGGTMEEYLAKHPEHLETYNLEIGEYDTTPKLIKYNLTIEPALVPEERHKIEDFLETMGYIVQAGGTVVDMSSCDIKFCNDIRKK